MKRCPFCSKEIQENAEFCLYCMRSLAPKTVIDPTAGRGKQSKFLLIIIILLLLVMLGVLGTFLYFNHNNKVMDSEFTSATQSVYSISSVASAYNQNTGAPSVKAEEIISATSVSAVIGSSDSNSLSPSVSGTVPDKVSSYPKASGSSSVSGTVSDKTSSYPKASGPSSVVGGISSNNNTSSIVTEAVVWETKAVDGGIEIVGIKTPSTSGEYSVPSSINGVKVVGIGVRAFYYADGIKSITLPDTIKYIGDQAFYGVKNIKSIVIPENVEVIGINAFVECSSLAHVYIKSANVSIHSYAFSSYYQREVELTLHAPSAVMSSAVARAQWDAFYEEWNG